MIEQEPKLEDINKILKEAIRLEMQMVEESDINNKEKIIQELRRERYYEEFLKNHGEEMFEWSLIDPRAIADAIFQAAINYDKEGGRRIAFKETL